MHSPTIINITLLTSQRGGGSGSYVRARSPTALVVFLLTTTNTGQVSFLDRSSNSIYATSAPTGAGATPASGVYEGTSMRSRDLVMLTTVFQC